MTVQQQRAIPTENSVQIRPTPGLPPCPAGGKSNEPGTARIWAFLAFLKYFPNSFDRREYRLSLHDQ